jgi:hypothetical protein
MYLNTENENESKIKKVLFNEVSFLIAGVGLVSSVMFWVMNPQQDMQLQLVEMKGQIESNQTVGEMLQKFKDNDLHELQLKMDQIESRQIQVLQGMSRLEAIHGIK